MGGTRMAFQRLRTRESNACAALLSVWMMGCGGSSPTGPSATTSPSSSPVTTPAATATPATVTQSPTYDVDALGVPRFITANYIDLAPIFQISRFRSGEGHSYSDTVETCRSMKHYFKARADVNWAGLTIYAPIDGEVSRMFDEQSVGTQVQIRSSAQPAFTVIIFHVAGQTVSVGSPVTAGQAIGHHVGSQTMSDVAISVDTPGGFRLVSWFDAITDELFETYRGRGLAERATSIISRAARDASPLSCSGEAFADKGVLENWVTLR